MRAIRWVALGVAASMAWVAHAAIAKEISEDEVVAIVKRVIKEQPELIVDSLQNMKEREMAGQKTREKQAIASNKNALTKNPLSPFIGNPRGDVVVAEFFDYHCGYCKRMLPIMQELVKADKNVKVVFKEFPIFGEDSENAAKAALAVNRLSPRKYLDYHSKLMAHQGEYDNASLEKYAEDVGVDVDDFRKAKSSEGVATYLAEIKKLGNELGIQGTPAMVIGDKLFPGAVDLAALKAAVAAQRGK